MGAASAKRDEELWEKECEERSAKVAERYRNLLRAIGSPVQNMVPHVSMQRYRIKGPHISGDDAGYASAITIVIQSPSWSYANHTQRTEVDIYKRFLAQIRAEIEQFDVPTKPALWGALIAAGYGMAAFQIVTNAPRGKRETEHIEKYL